MPREPWHCAVHWRYIGWTDVFHGLLYKLLGEPCLQARLGDKPATEITLLYSLTMLLLTYLLALCSYHAFEKHFLRVKRFFEPTSGRAPETAGRCVLQCNVQVNPLVCSLISTPSDLRGSPRLGARRGLATNTPGVSRRSTTRLSPTHDALHRLRKARISIAAIYKH